MAAEFAAQVVRKLDAGEVEQFCKRLGAFRVRTLLHTVTRTRSLGYDWTVAQ